MQLGILAEQASRSEEAKNLYQEATKMGRPDAQLAVDRMERSIYEPMLRQAILMQSKGCRVQSSG